MLFPSYSLDGPQTSESVAPPSADECWSAGSDTSDSTGPATPMISDVAMATVTNDVHTWQQCAAKCMASYEPYGNVHIDTPVYFQFTGIASMGGTCSCGTAAVGQHPRVVPGITTTGASTIGRACAYKTGRLYFNGVEVAKEAVLGSKLDQYGGLTAREPWGTDSLFGLTIGAAARAHPDAAPLWKGTIDELALWRRAITHEEARAMHRTVMGTGQIIGEWAGVATSPPPAPPILDRRVTCCDSSGNSFYASKWREYVGQWIAAHSNGDWSSNNAAYRWMSEHGYGDQCCAHGADAFGQCTGGWGNDAGGFECAVVRRCIAAGCAAVDSGEFTSPPPPAPFGSGYNSDQSAYVRIAHGTEVVANCPDTDQFVHTVAGGCSPAQLCGPETRTVNPHLMSTSQWYDYCFARCDAAGATLAQITTDLTHRGGRTCECKPASCAAAIYRNTTNAGVYDPTYTALYMRASADLNAGRRMQTSTFNPNPTTCMGFTVDTATKTCTFYAAGYPTIITTGLNTSSAVFWKPTWPGMVPITVATVPTAATVPTVATVPMVPTPSSATITLTPQAASGSLSPSCYSWAPYAPCFCSSGPCTFADRSTAGINCQGNLGGFHNGNALTILGDPVNLYRTESNWLGYSHTCTAAAHTVGQTNNAYYCGGCDGTHMLWNQGVTCEDASATLYMEAVQSPNICWGGMNQGVVGGACLIYCAAPPTTP